MSELLPYADVHAQGLLFMGDPHCAATPPGRRLEGYAEQINDKLRFGLAYAREHELVPVLLGDLFHWPRENPNRLMVELLRLFAPHVPFANVGNHDKHEARLTDDCSISLLAQAGVLRLFVESGPQVRVRTPQGTVLLCATPDGQRLPKAFKPPDGDEESTVVWVTHHNLLFPGFEQALEDAAGSVRGSRLKEISGVHHVVNGHIHMHQQPVSTGVTTWHNPGNIARVSFTEKTRSRVPCAYAWRPGQHDTTAVELPHKDFYEVFPRVEFPEEAPPASLDSGFLQGLAAMRARRTAEGAGLKDFLTANLPVDDPTAPLVWELYEEVVGNANK